MNKNAVEKYEKNLWLEVACPFALEYFELIHIFQMWGLRSQKSGYIFAHAKFLYKKCAIITAIRW